MNDTAKFIRESIAVSGGDSDLSSNAPRSYADRQKQLHGKATRQFVSKVAQYATDYVEAEVQGLTDNFYEWVKTKVRFTDITTRSGTSQKSDDWKMIMFPEIDINYFPLGAKVRTMGSTWLCVNPTNISVVNASAIVRRCNTSYNSYDEYGNVHTEPIIVENDNAQADSNESPMNMVLMASNYRVICQLNEFTKRLGQDKRIVLGTKPYTIVGYNDFLQEFSGDRESAHVLTFTAKIDEPTINDDVSENFIAHGNINVFSAEIEGKDKLIVGETSPYLAKFTINGINPTDISTTFNWFSSDNSIIDIDEDGVATAQGVGECVITASMKENTDIVASKTVIVSEPTQQPYMDFIGLIPTSVTQYLSEEFEAVFYDENGIEHQDGITWTFEGANDCYTVDYSQDNSAISITCLRPSESKLIVTAHRGDYSCSTEIELFSY